MAANEVRIAAEGELRFVQASGFSGTWTTAAAAATRLLAFAEELRMNLVPPAMAWVRDRGVLSHAKRTNDGGPYEFEVRCNVVNTATLLSVVDGIGTASGVSVKKVHIEYKSKTNEDPTISAVWSMGHHCVLRDHGFEEGEDGNKYRLRFECQSAVHPTASGYLS
jgi:hypothetical protein